MRKLILAPMALACLIGSAVAQQAPTSTVDQGRPGTSPWPITWTGQSVAADLRVAGSAVASGNPIPVSVGNFPTTQAVTQSGTWSFGLTGPIPAGSNVIGAVTQSGGPWSVSGTVAATQSGTWGVGINAGTNAIGSVLSDLRVAGAAVAAGNPVPVSVGNFPASQAVTNAGTFAVQNTAPVVGGNTAAVKTDGSAVTQPVSGTVAVSNALALDATLTGRLGTLGQKAMTGSTPVAIASDQGPVAVSQSGPWNVGLNSGATVLTGQYNATLPTLTTGTYGTPALDSSGRLLLGPTSVIIASLNTTNANIGAIGTTPAALGVSTISRLPSSAASTNLTQVKAATGRLYKVVACNTTTTAVRAKFYNALSANVTVGTTAPFLVRPIPPAAAAGGLACVSYDMSDIGWSFSTGLSYALVTGAADSDATAPAAGAVTDLSVEVQ